MPVTEGMMMLQPQPSWAAAGSAPIQIAAAIASTRPMCALLRKVSLGRRLGRHCDG